MPSQFLFHAQTKDGLIVKGNELTITLLTDASAYTKVQLRHEPDNEEYLVDMTCIGAKGRLKIWQASIPVNLDRAVSHYLFKVVAEDKQYWLDGAGIHRRMPGKESHFKYNSQHRPPEWVSEQVFYQIFPERFCNGDPALSVKTGEYPIQGGAKQVVAKEWGDAVSSSGKSGQVEFFGGDLAGVHKKLDYLEQLGVSALYLNPVFAAPSNHKYDTTDYFNVDPHFGTNQDLASLSHDIHQRGMRLILDAVFNHTSAEHPWFDKYGITKDGAYHSPQSGYRDYYFFDGDSRDYVGWKGVANLPVLNFENPKVRDYIYQSDQAVIRHWLREPYCVDGWRFDVIHMLGEGEGALNNAHYVQAFRQATKQENRDAFVLGEHFFEASQWLQGDQEDGAMNYYGFAHPIRALLAQRDIAYDPIEISMKECVDWMMEAKAKIPWHNQLSQLNQLDSHDTARFLTLLEGDERKMKIAAVLLFAYLGAPCLYYGTEVGLEGGNDPDNRRCFPWERVASSDWFGFYQRLTALRRERISLQKGALQTLHCCDKAWVFSRQYGEEVTICAINLSPHPQLLSLPVWQLGIEEGEVCDMLEQTELAIEKGEVAMPLGEQEAKLFKLVHRLGYLYNG